MIHLITYFIEKRGRASDLAIYLNIGVSNFYKWTSVPKKHHQKISEYTGISVELLGN